MSGTFLRLDPSTAAHLADAIRDYRRRSAQRGIETPDRLRDVEWLASEIANEPATAVAEAAAAREVQLLALGRRGADDREPIQRFLDECCELDGAATTSVAVAAAAYEAWADREGEDPITPMKLTFELRKRGVQSARTKRTRLYRGLRVTGSDDSVAEGRGQASACRRRCRTPPNSQT
jgi:hypothetical protein